MANFYFSVKNSGKKKPEAVYYFRHSKNNSVFLLLLLLTSVMVTLSDWCYPESLSTSEYQKIKFVPGWESNPNASTDNIPKEQLIASTSSLDSTF